jgi:hypothetical protein
MTKGYDRNLQRWKASRNGGTQVLPAGAVPFKRGGGEIATPKGLAMTHRTTPFVFIVSRAIASLAIVSFAILSLAIVSFAIVSFAILSLAIVSFTIVNLGEQRMTYDISAKSFIMGST